MTQVESEPNEPNIQDMQGNNEINPTVPDILVRDVLVAGKIIGSFSLGQTTGKKPGTATPDLFRVDL